MGHLQLISRFYGPVSPAWAVDITEIALSDEDVRQTFENFLTGFIDARELAYQLQVIFENTEERIKNAVECMDEWKREQEEAML